MRMKTLLLILSTISTPTFSIYAGVTCRYATLTGEKPLVIGHRGASGYRPEHTLASYQLAMEMGADFIEPDLVMTKDGQLVARHEPDIINTTDILQHPEFANRRTTKSLDGTVINSFFAEDFTLAELKTLRAVQSRPFRDQSFNGMFEIPSFKEIIALVKAYEKKTGRAVGIFPETKHPSYFRQQGLPLESKLIDALVEMGFTDPKRVFIQSFEVSNLRDILPVIMSAKGIKIPLVQLFDEFKLQPYDYKTAGLKATYGDLIQKQSLRDVVAGYAAGIGVWKGSFIKREPLASAMDLNKDGKFELTEKLTGEVLPVVADAHAAGLLVHPYTMRDEEQFLALGYASPMDEYTGLMALGVDGFFSDFPDTALRARTIFCQSR